MGEHEVTNHTNYASTETHSVRTLATTQARIPITRTGYTSPKVPVVKKPIKKANNIKKSNVSTATTIDRANQKARVKPNESGYNNAIMQYDFSAGALYQVYTAPLRITDIQLQPNEKIIGSPAAGDTARWVLGVSDSIKNGQAQKHILIKPTRPDLKTTLIINTNRRTYLLELNSYKETYMPAVSWHYPQDELRRQQAQQKVARLHQLKQQAEQAKIPVKKDFGYKISYKGDKPKWVPVQVFDDKNKVYIRFSKDRQRYEAPALFIINNEGKTQLVNYRVKDDFYVVDRLFETAELRAGKTKQTVITIRKKSS